MDLKTAYSTLELPKTSSKEEVKKKYKELTKKFHPDVNKSPDAEDKFKKINEAYNVITNHKESKKNHNYINPFEHDFHSIREITHIQLKINISFKESVVGTKKDISYNRKIKCASCNGNGEVSKNNGCTKCHGRGALFEHKGNAFYHMTCDKCFGVTNKEPCVICSESGVTDTTTTLNVTVPAGIPNNSVLRLSGKGNFAGQMMMMENYTDVFITVEVEQEEGLSLVENDVVSNIDISLLEALKGCSKETKTINGIKKIDIKTKTLNKDEVLIPKLGVAYIGNHRVIINVKYPDNVDNLINLLQE